MIIRNKIILLFALPVISLVISCEKDSGVVYPVNEESPQNKTDKKLLVAMGDQDYPPFEYIDKSGKPAGFNIDILRGIAAVMNLNIEIILGPWNEVRDKLEKGEIDILAGMYKTPERHKRVDFTIPHFISTYVIFVRDGSDIKSIADIKGKDVIVQDGDLGHDFIVQNGIAGRIIIKSDWADTISALSRGEGDCALVALLQGVILIDKLGIKNLHPLTEPVLQRSYCIAVTEGNSELLAKLNEGLNILKVSGEYDRVYEKWFSVYETKNIFFHPYIRILIFLFVLLLLTVSGIYFWNILLQRRVKDQTSELKLELEKSDQMKVELQDSLAELARSKEEAMQSKLEAEKSSEAKSFFLAGVSHELRTPLNGILGMTNLLYNTDLTKDQKGLLEMLKASADNLFRLMADLLEFSRVASGKFRFEILPVNLDGFVNNTASVIKIQAEEKGLSFTVKNSSPDVILLIDKDRVGQVIFNLAGNAVKYTSHGCVAIDIFYDGWLNISVTDTGIGMDMAGIEEIFNPFMQKSSEGAIKNKGLGLGLAIVKLLIETMGGNIDVNSIPGKGSTFIVKIPCRDIKLNAAESAVSINARRHMLSDVELDKLSVLITEDDQINRVYLERILQKKGWLIDISDNGTDAVEKSQLKRFDVILMDLNLPGLDGLAATEKIRSFEKTHGLKPSAIIAVTAHAYPEDMEKCITSGMDGYLSKPFSGKKLMDEIKRVLVGIDPSLLLY